MKPNSNGSVTPQTKAQIAAETTRPIAAFLFLGSLDHGQSSTGNAEHHAGEEAGHVHAEVPGDTVLAGDVASPVVAQVAQTDGVKPEHVFRA